MTNNLMGWRQYRGRIIPKSAIVDVVKNAREYSTRLKMGEHVQLRVDEAGKTQFISSVVVDVAHSHRSGAMYALAFPATLEGDFYIVVDGFSGAGMQFTHDESAEASGIYTEAEYEEYQKEQAALATPPARNKLRLVTSALDEEEEVAVVSSNSTIRELASSLQ